MRAHAVTQIAIRRSLHLDKRVWNIKILIEHVVVGHVSHFIELPCETSFSLFYIVFCQFAFGGLALCSRRCVRFYLFTVRAVFAILQLRASSV